jgi:IclR family pca regulon transcriptional regulator
MPQLIDPTIPNSAIPKSGDHLLVLERGLAVIECFDGRTALSVSEVAVLAGLSRAAARRCLLTLVTLRYATFDGRLYRLAPRVLRLGYAFLSRATLPQIVQPSLERLSAVLRESCSAGVLDDTDLLYVARAATGRIISVDLHVGSRLPAYCTAMGRVLLAAQPIEKAEAVLRRSDLVKRTPATLTDVTALLGELRRVTEQGYSIVHGELEAGLLTVAVPVHNAEGAVVAALNVGTHADRSTPAKLLTIVLPRLRELQAELAPLLRP